MNKKSLLNKVYIKSPFSKEKSAEIFDRMIELLKETIKTEKSFKIKNFGKFKIEHREMQTAIDINKKTELLLPPKDKVVFIASQKLIERINE